MSVDFEMDRAALSVIFSYDDHDITTEEVKNTRKRRSKAQRLKKRIHLICLNMYDCGLL